MFLSLPPFWASWLPAPMGRAAAPMPLPRPAELRVDVYTGPDAIAQELQSLHDRLHTPGDSMHGIERLDFLGDPRFTVHYREADGEQYIYVEDLHMRRLAGYTVFNRLVELNRRADRVLRAPHTKFAPEYQRQGLATAIYRWALGNGQCLISGARQSPGAHALWNRLAQGNEQGYVHLQDKTVTYLGTRVDDERLLDHLNTRRILLGEGWSIDGLAATVRMHMPLSTAWAGHPREGVRGQGAAA